MTHTKGPWLIESRIVITHESTEMNRDGIALAELIGRVYEFTENDLPNGQNFANARLIAAAPELLEALKMLLGACEAADVVGELYEEIDGELMDQARSAIAKAEGNQP